jgi:predicted kinase
MSERVVLLAGLPGCGKTTYLCEMFRNGWLVFDDFKSNAFDHSPEFRKSRKFRALTTAVRDGLKCALADIDFCREESRAEAERVLATEAPDVVLCWYFFAKEIQACEENIRRRNRPSLQADIEMLRKYSVLYQIPPEANVLPVCTRQA